MKTLTNPITHSIQSSFRRFRQVGVAACALALLVATATSALAESGKPVPIHGSQTNVTTLTAYGETYVGNGNSSYLGEYVSHGVNKFLGLRADGLFHGTGTQTDVAANGDTTITTFDWTVVVSVPQAEWVVRSTWKTLGGTGQFKNATGHGTSEGRFNAAGNLVNVWTGNKRSSE